MKMFGIVFCFLCVNIAIASESYKAGVINGQKEINSYKPFIHDAAKMGVDILVLPALEPSEMSSYDETVKTISSAAKQAGLYVVLHLFENTYCQLGKEAIRSNLVFDREGSIVAVYRKPVNAFSNCTTSTSDLVTFKTDFGVTFGLLMEEDLVLQDPEHLRGLKNFVMAGAWHSEIPMLSAPQFSSPWSYVNNANLLTNFGVYSRGLETGSEELSIVALQKNGGSEVSAVPVLSSKTHPSGDLTQYVIRPLDLEASSKGVKDIVCHGRFCCDFFVKTAVTGSKPDVTYSLAAFDGVRQYSASHNIGTQNCAVLACTGLNQKKCESGSSSTIFFERISIAANFTKQTSQYPIVQTVAPTDKITFYVKSDGISNQVTLTIVDGQNIVNFGIFGRDFAKDFETSYVFGEKNNTKTDGVYDFIYNEEVQEVVDYIWIRLRVLIVVVSIYILEMM